MNINHYLLWFEENRKTVNRFFDGVVHFSLAFDTFEGGRWEAGYMYTEDYDGSYFLGCLQGSGENALDALSKSYNVSLPLVEKLDKIVNLEPDICERFDGGVKYVVVKLTRDGRLRATPMVALKEEDGGTGFRGDDGQEYYYRAHKYRFIFDRSLSELLDLCGRGMTNQMQVTEWEG